MRARWFGLVLLVPGLVLIGIGFHFSHALSVAPPATLAAYVTDELLPLMSGAWLSCAGVWWLGGSW